MEQKEPLVIEVRLTARELWKFSMYHSYKGLLGLFNVIFSAAAVFLLAATWSRDTVPYRVLLIVCALMFTVWQPALLYGKAARQAKTPAIKTPLTLSFDEKGITAAQGTESLELEWEKIGRVEQGFGMLIIYMDRVHAYLLPDSVTGEKKAALCGLIKEKLPSDRRKRV